MNRKCFRRSKLGGQEVNMSDIRAWKHKQEENKALSWTKKHYK